MMKKNCVTAVKKLVCLGLAASLMWSAPFAIEARADAAVEGFWNTAYDVDYYVEVSAPDGGVNFRSGAGVEYGKILNSMIPNGTMLHIEMEARADNGKMWGQTQYQGYWGWVALSQTKKTNGGHTPPAAATAAAETQAQQSYGIGRVVETEPETAAPSYGIGRVVETEPETQPWTEPAVPAPDVTPADVSFSLKQLVLHLLELTFFLP